MANRFCRARLFLSLVLFPALLTGCVIPLPRDVTRQRNLEYGRASSQSLRLDLYEPKHPAGPLPVLVWIHGGSWLEGDKNFCPIGFMATQNLAIVSIDYRLSGIATFPAQIYDCKGAIRWLRANADKYHLDPDHIGVFGASAGGHLAALLGTTAGNPKLEGDVGGNLEFSSRVQAVCAFYPPTDLEKLAPTPELRTSPKTSLARLMGGPVEQNLDKLAFASPVNYASRDSAAFFLMHGDKDTLVPLEQSQELYDALKRAGAEVYFEAIPGQGHGIIAPPAVAQKIYEFLQRHLHYTPQTAAQAK